MVTAVLAAGALSGVASADEFSACMADRLQRADDGTTVGELRRQCQEQLRSEEQAAVAQAEDVVSRRLR